MQNGISIIIQAQNAAPRLDQLLSSFFKVNTHIPVEVLVLDQDSTDSTSEVLARYATTGCIRQFVRRQDNTASFGNRALHKARYPYLLFLSTEILFVRDVLPLALDRLEQDMELGAVTITPRGRDQRPVLSTQIFPDRSTAFLFCSKNDFERLSGFSPEADFLFFDLCQRMEREFDKRCLEMNEQEFLALQEPSRICLRYFPAYTNPYQELLYAPFPRHFQIQSGSLDDISAEIQKAHTANGYVFHLHWTNPVLQGAESLEKARKRIDNFLHKLDEFCALGGILVWTVHNLLPHETLFPELEKELRQELVSRAQVIHVHSPRVPELVRSTFEIPLHKTVLAPHGNYLGVYPVTMDREQARQELDLPRDVPVFLFLGQIRAYKGLHRLQSAFAVCLEKFPESHLLVAGKVREEEAEEIRGLFSGMQQCRLHPYFVPDEQLGNYLQAADYVVLPYQQVLTSGSVILAQSFGLPPIVPDLGLLREHVQDGRTGYLYDSHEPNGLDQAMTRALEDYAHYADLSAGALEAAHSLPWEHSAAVLAARIGSEVYAAFPGH